MATVEKTVSILFSGDDQLSGKVKNIEKQFSSFAGNIGDITAPLAGMADNILKVDAALVALAVGGLVYAFSKSSEFESAVVELKKVLGDQPEALEAATKAAFDLSRQYGESSSAVLLSSANFKQAGFDIEESIMLTKNAMDLSIAGSIESSEASELLIATLKGFKSPATEAARLVDVLNEVSNNYATNVHELGIGMAELSPIANLMGFSFEETAGILTPVIEIFRSGEEAATSLKMGLLKLVDDAKPVQDALAALGVAQTDVNGKLRSGKDILYDVAVAFQTAEENDKLFLAAQLVGIRQAGKMVEVFNGLAKSTEITNVAMGAAGSAALEVAARLESSEVAVKRFTEGFKNLAIVVGDQFKDAAVEAIDGGTAIENALEDIIKDGTFDPVFNALSDFGVEIGDYLKGIAEVLPEAFEGVDFDDLLDAFGDLGKKFGEMFADVDLTKPEDLKEVIQFVVDSLESLVRVTEGMAGPLGDFVEWLINLLDEFNNLEDGSKNLTGELLGWGKVINEVAGYAQSLLGAVEGVSGALKILVGIKVASWLSGLAGISAIAVPAGLALGIAGVGAAIVGIGTAIAADKLVGWLDDIGIRIPSGLPEFIETTKEEFDAMNRVIAEVNASLDAMDFKTPVVDIKEMLSDPAFSDAEINYAITGELSDLEAALEEAGVLIKEKPLEVKAETAEAEKKIEKVKEAVTELPSETLLEIKLKGEIDTEIERIKATAETAQTAMEWTAKLNITEAEADAKTFQSIVEGVSTIIDSTGDSLSSLFGLLADDELSTLAKWKMEDQIEKESKMREEAHKEMMKLNEAQREYMEAKTEALESGEGLITIKADGLEPELKAFMWKIIEMVQIRANEENAEFLLGL